MKEQQEQPVCEKCGKKLIPAFARFDGDPTFVGCLPHTCEPVKTEEKDKEIAMLKDALKSRDILQEEDRQEIERLKGLIEVAFRECYSNEEKQTVDKYLKTFKILHNL